MENINGIIFIWQLIAVLMTIIIIILLVVIIKSQKDYNKIYQETVNLIEFSNKQLKEIIEMRKELKEKTNALKKITNTQNTL